MALKKSDKNKVTGFDKVNWEIGKVSTSKLVRLVCHRGASFYRIWLGHLAKQEIHKQAIHYTA